VQLTDVTSDTATFSLIGPESDALLDQLGATYNLATHQLQMGSCEVRVAVVVAWRYLDTPSSPQLKTRLRFGALSKLGSTTGRACLGTAANRTRTPSPDQELSDDYNPLEAGLWQTISFEKGCYIVKPSPV